MVRVATDDSGGLSNQRQLHDWLASIFLRNVLGHARTFTGKDVSKQTGIVKLVEEPFDRSDVERFLVVAPENLVPGNGRAVKQDLAA